MPEIILDKKTKLATVIAPLLAGGQAKFAEKLLTGGIKNPTVRITQVGDKALHAEILNKPDGDLAGRILITTQGVGSNAMLLLAPNPDRKMKPDSKAITSLEDAISMEDVMRVEATTNRAFEVERLAPLIESASSAYESSEVRRHLGTLGTFGPSGVHGLDRVRQTIGIEKIANAMNRITNDHGFSVLTNKEEQCLFLISNATQTSLARIARDGSVRADSITAKTAAEAVVKWAVLAIDATMDLHAAMKAKTLADKAAQEAEWAEHRRAREAQALENAHSTVAEYSVQAGSTFRIRIPDYEGDILRVFVAERDIGPEDFARMTEGADPVAEGWAKDAPIEEYYLGRNLAERLRTAVERVKKAEEAGGPEM